MIGNDDIDSAFARGPNRGKCSDPAINGYDEFYAFSGKGPDPLGVKPIPLPQSIGYVVEGIQPRMTQEVDQNGRAREPVNVIVSIDQNPFFSLDGLQESLHSLLHPPKQRGGPHLPERDAEKPLRLIYAADSPTIENA